MAPKKSFASKMLELDGVWQGAERPVEILEFTSPSMNMIFGSDGGVRRGASIAGFAPPKGGKSLLVKDLAGNFLAKNPGDDKTEPGVVAVFDTEFRYRFQSDPTHKKAFKVDRDEFVIYEGNNPMKIFDRLANEIGTMCKNGMNLGLVAIDSSSAILGRRALAGKKSIETQQIGDVALTIKEGLKLFLPVQREYNITLFATCHVTAEMDRTEQMRGNKFKMSSGYGLQHHCEHFLFAEAWIAKAGRTDGKGNLMENKTMTMASDGSAGERTGHKIKVTMKDNSSGPKGRVAVFTLDYHKGVVNTHEEVVILGKKTGVLSTPPGKKTGLYYEPQQLSWLSEKAAFDYFRDHPEACDDVMMKIRKLDAEGAFSARDEQLALKNGANLAGGASEEFDATSGSDEDFDSMSLEA